MWRDDEHCVQLCLVQHVLIIGERQRLLLDRLKNLPLITVKVSLVRVAQRHDLRPVHLSCVNLSMVAAHAAATDDPKTYLLHSARNPSKWACPRQTIRQRCGGDEIDASTVRHRRARGRTDDG